MNRKTEVKVKFFDFLIMLQLSFAFRLPECSRPIIATFPCILFCVVVFLIIESFLLLRAAMVLRHVSSNRCVAVCIYIFLCVEVVYGFHSVLGFFHFLTRRTRLPPRCLRKEQKITIEQPNHPLPGRKDNPRTTGASRKCFCRPFYIDE